MITIFIKVNKHRKELKDQRKNKELKIVTMIVLIMYKNMNNKNKIVKSKKYLMKHNFKNIIVKTCKKYLMKYKAFFELIFYS